MFEAEVTCLYWLNTQSTRETDLVQVEILDVCVLNKRDSTAGIYPLRVGQILSAALL
jgi:hypothetical protein